MKTAREHHLDSLDEFPTVTASIERDFNRGNYGEAFEKKIIPALVQQHTEGFMSETDPNGMGWAPLSPYTIAKKGHDTILVDTGDMRRSILGASDGIANHITRIEVQELIWGSSDPKLPSHMTGRANMPARPALGVGPKTLDLIVSAIADETVEILKG